MTLLTHGTALPTAEILLWQARFRRAFVGLVGFLAISLKWAGLIRSDSILATQVGSRNALLACGAVIAFYLALNEWLMIRIAREGRAGAGVVNATLIADYVLLFFVAYCTTPPAEFDRVLIVAIFVLQFTRLYFGLRAMAFSLIGAAAGYTGLIILATKTGMMTQPAEEFWDLAIFLLGALLLSGLQGQVSGRIERLVQLFDRAQEGDFSATYDESLDRMPDPITVVGRSYNRMRARLESIVLTDPLSGCFNRRGFDQLSTREVSRAIRGSHPIAVLAIDVDHFKRINDEFGHLTGDEVLREMGARLRETARAGDVVARYGGEEFEILAPDTAAAGAMILADRIQAAFRTRPFASAGNRKISVSIGIAAEVARNDQVVPTLVARADEALYVAKRNGRDRSQLWEPGLRAFDGSTPGRRSMEIRAVPGEQHTRG